MTRTNWWMVSTLILVGLFALVIVAGMVIQEAPFGWDEGWHVETQSSHGLWEWVPGLVGFSVLKVLFRLLMPVFCFSMLIVAIIGCTRKAFWRCGPESHWQHSFHGCPECGRPAKAEWSLCPQCGSDLHAQRTEG